MFGFATDTKNGNEGRRSVYADRLARALHWDNGVPAERSVEDEPSSAESPLNSLQASTSCELPVPGLECHGLREHPASPADTVERKPDKFLDPNGMRIEQACKSIADALLGTVVQAAEDLRRQAASDHAKLEAAADSTSRFSQEIDQVRAAFASMSPRVESLAQGEAGLRIGIAALNDRFRREEELSQRAQERLDKLLTAQEESTQQVRACARATSDLEARTLASGERLDALSGSMQAQIDANVRLHSLCAKLEARLASQEHSIQALETEIRQRGGLVERLLGLLRSLDLRREPRFAADKAVKVAVRGEQEAVVGGRIVNASENGLGLLLESPTPVGNEVRIDVDDTQVSGKVIYCGPRGDGYAAGVRLADPVPTK